jgi:outer membrane protein
MKRLLILFSTLTLFNLGSQDSLSLEEVILRTLNNNYQIQISKKNIEIADIRNKWGEAGRWPTVNFSLANNYNFIDNTNNPAAFPPGSRLFTVSLNPGIDFNWVLFSGMGIKMQKENLQQLENQSLGNSMVIVENTIQTVMLSYYTALLNQEKLKIMRKVVEFSSDKLEYYERREDLGLGGSLESLQFKNQYLNDSTILLNYKIAFENSIRNISILMGDTAFSSYYLSTPFNMEIPEYSIEELEQITMENNQNIKNQYINMALQDANIGMAKSQLYPTISLNGGANFNTGYINFITQDQTTNSFSPSYFAGINIRYAIYNNGRNKRGVQVAKVQREMEELNLNDIKLTVKNDLHTQYSNFANQKLLVNVSEDNLEYSKQVWELGKKKYESSTISYFELNDYQNNYRNTLLNHLDNKFSVMQTYLEIFRITGGILQQYSGS